VEIELRERGGGVEFAVRVVPRAKRNEIAGERNGALCVRVSAPPVGGAANAALCAFLAELLGVRRSAVSIVAGERSRAKRVLVLGLSHDEVQCKLEELLG